MASARGKGRGRGRALVFVIVFLGGGFALYAAPPHPQVVDWPVAQCVQKTPELAAMPWVEVTVADAEPERGETAAVFHARLAATGPHRAAGMQHLCPEAIAVNPILFVFAEPTRPAFHMDNVHAALDIAFINANGVIVAIERMTPDQRTLTRANQPVAAALELPAGRADAYGLVEGMVIKWSQPVE
ncbi:DUF192 domain-containing protein [Aquisalimonas sp.]|uniref:DUF192 domain-containing protein n=1 Tax=Aquisalimonas sp. TaxID=1872621 RepID=UPI0025C13DDA|nr:DUF192 domain-containing protein [Aquisalimonas sp.]